MTKRKNFINKEIKITGQILRRVESKKPDQIYGRELTISDINLFTQAIKKNPGLDKRILNAIEENKFDLYRFISSLKTKKINLEKNKRKIIIFNKQEIKKIATSFKKKGFKNYEIIYCIQSFSQKYKRPEVISMLNNISKIIDIIPEQNKPDFIDRIIFESKQIEKNKDKKPFNLIFEKIIQEEKNSRRVITVIKKLLRKHL